MKFYNKTSETHTNYKCYGRIEKMCIGGYYLISLALIIVGFLGTFTYCRDKIVCKECVPGKVTDVEVRVSHSRDDDGENTSYSYYPVFGYTYGNFDYSFKGSQSTSDFKTGQKVDVYVDADDPTHAFVPKYTTPLTNGIIFLIAGIGMAVGMAVHIKRVIEGARNYYANNQ